MNLLVMIFILLSLFVSGQVSLADVVLIPHPRSSFAAYRESCEKASYICSDKYFIDIYYQKETPQFDELINSIDLSSTVWVQTFSKSLTKILQAEMISEVQLEMVLKLVAQVKEIVSNKNQISMLEAELKRIKDYLAKTTESSPSENFIIFFKRKMTEKDFLVFKSTLVNIPAVWLHYSSMPKMFSAQSRLPKNSEDLLSGRCETAQLNKNLNLTGWQAYTSESCSLTEDFSAVSKTVTTHITENKKWWIAGAVVVGAAILLNRYDLQFQF